MTSSRFKISARNQILLLFGSILLAVFCFWFFGVRDIQQKRAENKRLRETLKQSGLANIDRKNLIDAIKQQTQIDQQLIKDWNTIHQRIALPMSPEARKKLKDTTAAERYEIVKEQIQQTFQNYVNTGRVVSFRNFTLNPSIPHLHNESYERLFEEYRMSVNFTILADKLYDFISTDAEDDFFFIFNNIRITSSTSQPSLLYFNVTMSALVFDYLYEE